MQGEINLAKKLNLPILYLDNEMVQSGYKVIISTHSRLFLEFAWAFNQLKESSKTGKEKALLKLFEPQKSSEKGRILLKGVFEKTIATYFFSRKSEKVTSLNISSLDVCDADLDLSEWGGLSAFSGKVSDLVSRFYHE